MPGPHRSSAAQANAFAACAFAYWLQVLPHVRREIGRWRERARSVPDPRLRELALETQLHEQGNLEGAAAFAVLAPVRRRAAVARAAIAFQAAYDFADTLAEQPGADPETRARRLHAVLLAALDERRAPQADPAAALAGADGGYLEAMAEACRASLRALPSYPLARAACLRAAERMVGYQCLTHAGAARRSGMRRWAERLGEPSGELCWWETAAGAASSLSVFALIAASARPDLGAAQVSELERAYFPFVGALHVLLDSLIDRAADELSGHHSLVSHYACSVTQAERLATITRMARAELRELPRGGRHEVVLAAMVCFYLSRWEGSATGTQAGLRRAICSEIGPLAGPTLGLVRLRRGSSGEALAASAGALSPARP